jgi:hypothetical protein
LKARIDLRQCAISNDQASETVQCLISEHQGDFYLEVASPVLLDRNGDRQSAISRLKAIAVANEGDSYVNQVSAGLIGCDRVTWDSALHEILGRLKGAPEGRVNGAPMRVFR